MKILGGTKTRREQGDLMENINKKLGGIHTQKDTQATR
jgi:hypothetical protein